jgi:hypothetical protein
MTYEIPREAMLQVGVRKGDNLFTCSRDGSKLSCTTRIFHPRCGKHDFAPWASCPTMKRTSEFAETPLASTASATRAADGRKTGRSLTCRRPNRGLPQYAQVAGVRLLGTGA